MLQLRLKRQARRSERQAGISGCPEVPQIPRRVPTGCPAGSENWIRLNLRRLAAVTRLAIMGNLMLKPLDPFRFLLITVAGWMNQHELQVIDYLREENRVLREQLGDRRLRLCMAQPRRTNTLTLRDYKSEERAQDDQRKFSRSSALTHYEESALGLFCEAPMRNNSARKRSCCCVSLT